MPQPPKDLPEQWIVWLNQRNLDALVGLYHSDAVHVTNARTVQGHAPIRQWYEQMLTYELPGAAFQIGPQTNKDGVRQVAWRAASTRGAVSDGSDTICIMDGKIAFHYTQYSIK
jgi:ketosteroid isomerase-like protein